MANTEKRKNFPKLVRRAYQFEADIEFKQQEDIIYRVQNCECDSGNGESLDPEQDDCFLDEYTICGNLGLDDETDVSSLPKYYLRPSDTNPDLIFIRSFGETGGCFAKGETPVACANADGSLLGMDEYEPMETSDEEPGCEKFPCLSGGSACPYLLFKICATDPLATSATFSPKYIIIRTSHFGGIGSFTVKYQSHCYSTFPIPCRTKTEPYTLVTGGSLTRMTSCNDTRCVCCSGILDTLNDLNSGIQERIRFLNNGNVSGFDVIGHAFSDPAYILNSPIETALGNTATTSCEARSESIRQWFAELNYWINRLYLSGFIDTEVHPDSDISGETTITTFNGAPDKYGPQLVGATWFNNAFGGPNVGNEMFTNGPEAGYGSTDMLRFGDSNPHVITNIAGNNTFCLLITETARLMMVALQKLQAVFKEVTGSNACRGKSAEAFAASYNDMLSCAITKEASSAFFLGKAYNHVCDDRNINNGGCSVGNGLAGRVFTNDSGSIWGAQQYNSLVERTNTSFIINLTAYPTSATGRVYYMFKNIGGTYTTSPWIAGNPPEHTYFEVDCGEPVVGTNWTAGLVANVDSATVNASDYVSVPLTAQTWGYQWETGGVVVIGSFTV